MLLSLIAPFLSALTIDDPFFYPIIRHLICLTMDYASTELGTPGYAVWMDGSPLGTPVYAVWNEDA
ncbi:hypothetical protein FACS189472_08870 [Alphaproteobacteria bacterium]|nr:hypothetical protein FACS189472_08870 [Alphaproteobacteria bacterium]